METGVDEIETRDDGVSEIASNLEKMTGFGEREGGGGDWEIQ